MMKQRVKRMLCALAVGACVCGTTLPVFADRVHFDITVPGSKPSDTVSKRTNKSDSEQNFYVTGTEFHKNGMLNCESIKVEDESVRSYVAGITPAAPSANKSYKKYAASNNLYYMAASSSVNDFHVCGRYTP